MSFFNILKNVLLILVLLNIAPVLLQGIKKQYSSLLVPKTQVGVIELRGLLYDSSHYNRYLHEYFENTDIKAILLKIECPGGAAGTSQAIFNEIMALKKEYPKPVIALVENICASGGYYVACAADHIVAPGTAMIGSIGASMPYFFQLKEFIEQFKIHYVPMNAGAFKSVGDPFTDLTEAERALLQTVLDDSYQQFAADVAKARNLPLVNVATWADGKVFSGNQAKGVGLIDETGSAYNAIRVVKEKGLIEGEIEWIKPPQQMSLLGALAGSSRDDEGSMFNVFATAMGQMMKEKMHSRCAVTL